MSPRVWEVPGVLNLGGCCSENTQSLESTSGFMPKDCSLTQHACGHVVFSVQSSSAADSLVPLLLGPDSLGTSTPSSLVHSTSAVVALAFLFFLCFSHVPPISRISLCPGIGRIAARHNQFLFSIWTSPVSFSPARRASELPLRSGLARELFRIPRESRGVKGLAREIGVFYHLLWTHQRA